MALDSKIVGTTSGNGAEVDASNNLRATLPGYSSAGVSVGGGPNNGLGNFSEIDAGTINGARDMQSAEVDDDFRGRVAHDNLMDQHDFCADTAQYTEKFFHAFTTMTATQSTAGMLTNSGNITTAATAMTGGTHAMFPVGGTETLAAEFSFSINSLPGANQTFRIGAFQRGAANPFTPLDGVYFQISAAGVQGFTVSNAGTPVASPVFPLSGGAGTFIPAINTTYRMLVQCTNARTTFWITNLKYGTITTPVSLNMPFMSKALPVSWQHEIVGGTAGNAMQVLVKDYRVYRRGPPYADRMSDVGARVFGSFCGLTAATIGTNGTYANSTNPVAAVPTNVSLAVGSAGLLNQAWETFTLAVNTDGILQSYQNPVGSATVPGRRLKIFGVKLSSFVQTVLAGGPCIRTFALNVGGTAVSLAQTESTSFASGTTKARRVILLPELTQAITAAQAVSTMISQPGGSVSWLESPKYINPGEYVQVSEKIIGTVGTSGTIVNHIQVIATPE